MLVSRRSSLLSKIKYTGVKLFISLEANGLKIGNSSSRQKGDVSRSGKHLQSKGTGEIRGLEASVKSLNNQTIKTKKVLLLYRTKRHILLILCTFKCTAFLRRRQQVLYL